MRQNIKKYLFFIVVFVSSFLTYADEIILEPKSWSFPDVIESARKISPNNLEGKVFNQFGLAYSKEKLSKLDVSRMRPEQLQNYADIVTHAYPDAIGKTFPNCSNLPVKRLNETTIAGIAFISINAKTENVRQYAKACLLIIQGKLQGVD